ncbi:MAG: hypothetical protein OXB84_08485 [Halobacteriovoraceae bacterium]|nr:hypothetical protein [Halobacteriovoraceae bacterium]
MKIIGQIQSFKNKVESVLSFDHLGDFKRNNWLIAATIFLLLLVINFKLIIEDPKIKLDDFALIIPLKNLSSVSQYITDIKRGIILDIQPVRDLSLLVNLKLEQMTSYGFYHGTNFILWLLILFFTYLLLKNIGLSRYALPLILILSVHPSALTCVFWISARKHLLAAFFILVATVMTIREKKLGLKRGQAILVWYCCSVLSHPMHILWPLWYMVYIYFPEKKLSSRQLLISIIVIFLMILFLYINYWYYSTIYLEKLSSLPKIASKLGKNLDISLLGVSRSFSQMFYPITSLLYYPGGWMAIMGIPLFSIFNFLTFKFVRKEGWKWSLFIFLPLIVVYGQMTNIFMSDTYLLLPLIGVLIVLAHMLENIKISQRFFKSMIFIICLFFTYKSYRWSEAWISMDKLLEYSYKVDKNPATLLGYGKVRFVKGEYIEATEMARRLIRWRGIRDDYDFFATVVYHNPYISIEKKIKLLNENYQDIPVFNHYIAIAHADQENWKEAYKFEKKALDQFLSFRIFHVRLYIKKTRIFISEILPNVKNLCLKAGKKSCLKEFDKYVQRISKGILK